MAYEAILANPEAQLRRLMSAAGVIHYDVPGLRSLIAAPRPRHGRTMRMTSGFESKRSIAKRFWTTFSEIQRQKRRADYKHLSLLRATSNDSSSSGELWDKGGADNVDATTGRRRKL